MDSILDTIKTMVGIDPTDTSFDTDIIVNTNSAFTVLRQLGVGPSVGFVISDNTKVWNDFLGDEIKLEAVKSYIYLKVRSLFDPPTSSVAVEAIARQITELEWRLNVQSEEGTYIPPITGVVDE